MTRLRSMRRSALLLHALSQRRLRFEPLEDRRLLALVADIVDVVPDPRTTPVGDVVINFTDTNLPVAVTGVDKGDFRLTRDGNLVPLDDSVTLTGTGATRVLNLAAVTIVPGTYQLTLVAFQSGIFEIANPNFFLEADAIDTWVMSTGEPTAAIATVVPNPRNSPVGNVTITFSEAVFGVDIGDFRLTRDGLPVDLTGLVVEGSGATRTINLSTVTAASGTYQLTLVAAGSGITDGAGFPLAGDAQVAWVTDATTPTATIQPITPNPRSTPVSNATIVFSEPVSGVDINDFRLTRNGTNVALTGLSVSGAGTTYTLDLTTVTGTAGTYVLTLVAANSGIVDALGNALATNATASWVTDTTTPLATIAPVTPNPRTTPVGIVTITFNEPVVGVDITDFRLTRNGVPVSLAGLAVNGSGTTYTLDLTGVTGLFGSYILTLVAAGSGITDLSGNPLTADASISFLIDDRLEENDTMYRARDLGVLSGPLTLAGLGLADANDWFRFTMLSAGSASASVSISFDHTQGDLDLELYSVSGQRLASSTGTSNVELISLAGRPAGTYYARVFGKAGASNPNYTLAFHQPPAPVDDAFEENDTRDAARDLGAPTAPLTIPHLALLDGHDWYRFQALATGTAADSVAITFLNALGNLDLELYDGAGNLLAASATTADAEQISLAGRPAGVYYVHVLGAAGASNAEYTLRIQAPQPVTGLDTTFNIQLSFSGLTADQIATVQAAAARWESIITGDLPAALYVGPGFTSGIAVDDILIEAAVLNIDGVGGVLGRSNNDRVRSDSGLPYHGLIELDAADLAFLESSGALLPVVMHEMAHVLGFGNRWADKGLVAGAGTANVAFTGAQAVAAYNAIFGLNATSVPVENTGGAGTANSHWRESVFGAEIMTGFYNPGTANPLSRITVAAMADLGYTVNLAAADAYTPPAGSAATTLIVSSTPASAGAAVLRLAPTAASGSSSLVRPSDVSLGPAPQLNVSSAQTAAAGLAALRNPYNPLDVSNDGEVNPTDALMVINALNDPQRYANSGGEGEGPPAPYYDTSGDGLVSPIDALLVINYLNQSWAWAGEGEAENARGPESPACASAESDVLLALIVADVASATKRR